MSVGEHCGGELLLEVQLLGEVEACEFEVLPMSLCEVDVGRVDIPVDDRVRVDVLDGLGQLVEDPPHLILGDLPALGLGPGYEVLERAAVAVLHEYVHGDVLLVDLVVEVPEDVEVVHADEGVDFVDDVLLPLGGEAGEGDLLEHEGLVAAPAPRLEHALPPLLHDFIAVLH